MKRMDALRKTAKLRKAAKYLVAGASSIALFATAFTTSALAEAKDSLYALDTNPLGELLQRNVGDLAQQAADTIQEIVETVSQDAEQLNNLTGDEALIPIKESNPDNTPATSLTGESSVPESLHAETTVNDDSIVIQGNLFIVQGDTSSSALRTAIQSTAGKATNTVLFKNQIVITTDHTDSLSAPFVGATWLKYIQADAGAKVSFAAAPGKNAPTLSAFFFRCTGLETLDGVSVWDVSNVTNMNGTFGRCSELTSLQPLSTWNVSNVTGEMCMNGMFENCSKLESLDGLSNWNVSNVKGDYAMYGMFSGCSKLASLDALSDWMIAHTTSAFFMQTMFKGCSGLSSLNGLSTWDVSGLNGYGCLRQMFENCSKLESLDGLSNWNVSAMSGPECMEGLFAGCTNLISLDAIASWDVSGAITSNVGVANMFKGCTAIESLTVNPPSGFQIDSSMSIPTAFTTGGNYWWPEKGATEDGFSTSEMITNSADTATYGHRWVRGEEKVNPYLTDVVPTVTWSTIAKSYTGFNQTIYPDKVEVDGVELTPGVDYVVYYTKATTGGQVEASSPNGSSLQIEDGESPTVCEEGAYTAKLYLQGKYIGKENPSYTQTVYVTAPGTVVLSFNAGEGTFASTGTNILPVINLVSGQTLDTVEEPTLSGYTFAGWEDESGNPVSFPLTIPDANTIYTATWSAEPGPGPTPPGPTPGPTPGPEPTPTPAPTPASDGTLIPSTGDTTSMASAAITLSAGALLGMAALGLALRMRSIKQRQQ